MSNLVDFLSKLGSDPLLADAYTQDPEATMAKAGLTDDEKNMLRNADLDKIKNATGISVNLITKIITSYKE